MTGQSGCPLVSSDELIGNIVQVTAYDLRLRADPRRSLPTRLISAALQPAATAPRVSHVWEATRQSWEGSTPSSLSTICLDRVPAVAQPFLIGPLPFCEISAVICSG